MAKTLATIEELKNFDVNDLSFGPMKKPDAGKGQSGPSSRPSRSTIKYKGNTLRIQTNLMILPFQYEQDPNNSTLTFCTKVSDMEGADEEYANAVIDVFKQVQAAAKKVAHENSQEWYQKTDVAFDDAVDLFAEPLKEHPEGKYPPHLKVKYYRDSDTGLPQFPVYDGNTREALHTRQSPCLGFSCADTFAASTRHILIVDCSGVWSLNRRGGLTWRVNDVLAYPPLVSFPFKNVPSVADGSHPNDEYRPPY